MKKVLISGYTGFVGKNLIPYLENEGCSIIAFSRQQLNQVSVADLSDVGTIVHLAGKAHDFSKVANPTAYYEANYELTKRIYDAFLKSDAEKFIFMSSVKAAADTLNGILKEELFPNPKTDYGKSKLMAEEYIKAQPLPAGKTFYILRPCMIHGPMNKGNLNLLYQLLRKGIPYPLAAFENRRSFLSVENLCFIISRLISDPPSAPEIYNVADDTSLSTNQLISIMAAAIGIKPRLWKVNPSLIKIFTSIGDFLHLPLNTQRLKKLTETYEVSNEKIKKALHLKELPISAQIGITHTIKSFESK